MRVEHVEVVGEIVGREFPRALDFPDLRHADELDLAGAAEDDVHVPAHVAEPVLERRRARVPAAEDEPAIGAETRDRYESELRLVELAVAVVMLAGRGQQLAVRCGNSSRDTGSGRAAGCRGRSAEAHAAVPARVQEHAHYAILVAQEEHRIEAALRLSTSPGFGISRFVSEEEPARGRRCGPARARRLPDRRRCAARSGPRAGARCSRDTRRSTAG